MIQYRNFEMRTVTSVAKRCVLFLLVVAIAATNGRDGDASSSLFASAAKCRDKSAKIIFGETKRNYCKWVGEDADVRCLDEKHKRKQNQNPESTVEGKKKKPPKFLKPLKKCKCTCKKYVETKQTDDDGCPLVTKQQFLLGFSPEFECEQPKRDCVYSYVYSGCTFDELQCLPFEVCECIGGSWQCYHLDPIPCEQEETRPPRTLGDGDRQLVEGGLPTPGDPCDPDAPLPKAHKATGDDNPWSPGEEDGLQI
mmetsp:Transcript_28835/g.78120  ORF Transcript_28835/g.78120 Transcript_28835/m.78120 type:complete len:253 (-) Transcript_28835:428-1186(-)